MRSLRVLCCCFLLVLGLAAARAAEPATVLVLGDSLSAGYGLDSGSGWVALLQRKLEAENWPYRAVNASVSGDTTAGGLARLPAALDRHHPAIVLIELGANDGLRALPVSRMRDNLSAMVALSKTAGAMPLLLEMRIPPNYGAAYAEQFRNSFSDVAKAADVPLVPFFLGKIAADPGKFQDDGIHPRAEAQPQLLEAVWPSLLPLLKRF